VDGVCTAALPISVHERGLSAGDVGQPEEGMAEKEGRSRSPNTERNRQTRYDVFLISCPEAPSARVIGGAGDWYTKSFRSISRSL
jgi:hypothetical protein